jgi:hypothetical protein
MPNTSLTLGGFNQPAVARSLIELPGNSEKGLSQRFLWIFPKPIYGQFATLEPVDVSFCDIIGNKCLYVGVCYSMYIYSEKVVKFVEEKKSAAVGYMCF